MTIFYSHTSLARCDEYTIEIFPKKEMMDRNSMIVINFSGSSNEIGQHLNSRYPIYLFDGKKSISLEVVEVNSSPLFLTQVLLRPSKKLKKGKEYTLKIDKVDASIILPVKKWTILDRYDEEIPKLLATPKELTKSYDKKPEGIQKLIRFETRYTDNSPVFIKCTMKDVSGAVVNTHYLSIDQLGQIAIGHNACFGAFEMAENTSYFVDFQIMDICGNYGEIIYKGVHFTSPKAARVVYKTTTTIIEE